MGMRMRSITMSESGRKGVAYLGEVELTNHVDSNPCHLHWNDALCPLSFFLFFSFPSHSFQELGLA